MTPESSAILVACDRLLGEIGRRDHMFGWLRVPDSDPPQWLSVDGYYPGNRLVVLCGRHPAETARLCAEAVPAHGLRLLELAEGELDDDHTSLKAALERRLAELPAVVRPSGQLPGGDGQAVRAASLLPQPTTPPVVRRRVGESRAAATARGARFVADREPSASVGVIDHSPPAAAPMRRAAAPVPPRRPPSPTRRLASSSVHAQERPLEPLQAPGVLAALALIAVLCLELYYGVALFALGGGHVLLAFGLALDCCARVLGSVAARRADQPGWMWYCALLGSPAVAMFALYGGEGEQAPEPGPLAGLLSLFALGAVVLAVVTAVL